MVAGHAGRGPAAADRAVTGDEQFALRRARHRRAEPVDPPFRRVEPDG